MDRDALVRIAAPAAFLLATTLLVLVVRASLGGTEPPVVATEPAGSAPPPATTTAPPETETTAPATTTEPPAETAASANTYTVEEGDTFATIADDLGTTVEELRALNPGVDPTALQIGQELRVP